MSLGERITEAYGRLNLKQAEAARRCGMGPQRFSNYVLGKRTPDIRTLVQIANALQVTPDWLLEVNESADTPLSHILGRLLSLEGIPEDRAGTIARIAVVARRLYDAVPEEGDPRSRARTIAHAMWSQPAS